MEYLSSGPIWMLRAVDLLRRGAASRPETAGNGEATLRCIALIELVTAYLDDELDARTRARVDQHLARCAGCAQYLQQMRVTACMVGKIRDEQLDPAFRDRLLDAFRGWN
jgi:Putative zinc-finger